MCLLRLYPAFGIRWDESRRPLLLWALRRKYERRGKLETRDARSATADPTCPCPRFVFIDNASERRVDLHQTKLSAREGIDS
jgi:hypothetical protein